MGFEETGTKKGKFVKVGQKVAKKVKMAKHCQLEEKGKWQIQVRMLSAELKMSINILIYEEIGYPELPLDKSLLDLYCLSPSFKCGLLMRCVGGSLSAMLMLLSHLNIIILQASSL